MYGYFYVASPCPPHYQLPFDALIIASWVSVAILCLDVAVMLMSHFIQRSHQGAVAHLASGRHALAVILALIAGLAVALGLTFSLRQQNLALCLIPGDLHYTPQLAAQLAADYAQIVRRAAILARATLAASLAIGALGTLATLLAVRRQGSPTSAV